MAALHEYVFNIYCQSPYVMQVELFAPERTHRALASKIVAIAAEFHTEVTLRHERSDLGFRFSQLASADHHPTIRRGDAP